MLEKVEGILVSSHNVPLALIQINCHPIQKLLPVMTGVESDVQLGDTG